MFLMERFGKRKQSIDKACKVGDVITFGGYLQDAKGEKLSPIEWLVLDKKDNECLLLSKYCLDTVGYCGPHFGDSTRESWKWENSYLRKWLNEEFYNVVFTPEEKKMVLNTVIITDDKEDMHKHNNYVFLISKEELEKYFPSSEAKQGVPTAYAIERGARIDMIPQGKTCWWILPHIEEGSGEPSRVDYPQAVFQHGEISYHSRNVAHLDFTVRPAIRIKL